MLFNHVCDACDTCDSTCDTCVTERNRWCDWVSLVVTGRHQKNSHTRAHVRAQGILYLSVTSVTSVTKLVSTLILKGFFCDASCDTSGNSNNKCHKEVFA